jgi:aspartyl-tRNA(Asn)/glutamyl-tRNA(Gln) amidotransferase subunit B
LTASKEVSDFFDETLNYTDNAKAASNWIMGELAGHLNEAGLSITDSKIRPQELGKLIGLIDKGTISSKIAKTVFEEMFATGGDPEKIIQEKGLVQISDEGELAKIVEEVIANNPQSVADFKAGKEKALGALVGQVMKATKGKANPQIVNKLMLERLT